MILKRRYGIGGLAMLLLLALFALGIGIALWSKVLTINGTVFTGSVNAEFVNAFTDDDNKQDNERKDFYDIGLCDLPPFDDDRDGKIDEDPIDGTDNDGDTRIDEDPPGKLTSCDPKETGAEDESNLDHRYDKDVAQCFAAFILNDQEPQPGSQTAEIRLFNGYPSYHCTAWFDVHNNGTIPVLLHSITILGDPATPCAAGVPPTSYDLNGDGAPDIEVCISGFECIPGNPQCREPQIDPSETFQMDVDIHIAQTAPQDALLKFEAVVCFHQWNEETGSCGQPNFDRIIDADGIASEFSGDPGAREVLLGQALKSWPAAGDEGLDMFDNDASDSWTAGDDLHLEDPDGACKTAARNAVFDDNVDSQDCRVIDFDLSLADQQPVSCDIEGMVDFNGPAAGGCDARVKFHDDNGDGNYDNGEDIVLDVNNNGVFD